MRKTLLSLSFLILIIGVCGSSYGEVIFEVACDLGGNITVDSSGFSYDPVSGNYLIIFQFNNCADIDFTINGTVNSSGTFKFTSNTTADVVIHTTPNVTVTDSKGGSITIHDCTGHYEGTHDLSQERLNGSYSLNCSGPSDGFKINIFDLLLGPRPALL